MSASPVAVRPATLDDLPAVCRLAELLAARHHAAAPHVFLPAGDPARDEAYWRESLLAEGRQGFVAEAGGQVLGFVTVALVREQGPLLQPLVASRVSSVCVDAAARRHGIGRALMLAAESWARSHGASEVRLVVWAFNAEAQSLYRRLGYATRSNAMVRTFLPAAGGGTSSPSAAVPAAAERLPVSLREITAESVLKVVRLAVAESQRGFVATNAVSLSQALFAPEAWYRAIHAGDEPVGFVMLEDHSLRQPKPAAPELGIWRFMIDAQHQGRGYGAAAMRLVIDHARSRGVPSLLLSYVPGEGAPEPFYRRFGFRPNGRLDGNEVVMELDLLKESRE